MIYKIPFRSNILLLHGNCEFYVVQQSHVPYLIYVNIIHMHNTYVHFPMLIYEYTNICMN